MNMLGRFTPRRPMQAVWFKVFKSSGRVARSKDERERERERDIRKMNIGDYTLIVVYNDIFSIEKSM